MLREFKSGNEERRWAGRWACRKVRALRLLALPALVLPSCITVNIHFPTEEVEEAAGVIVDEVRPEDEKPVEPSASGKQAPAPAPPREDSGPEPQADLRLLEGGLSGGGAFAAFIAASWADEKNDERKDEKKGRKEDKDGGRDVDDVDDPVIDRIKATLKDRYPRLLPFYEKGALGETRKGLVEAREEEKLPLAERRALKNLVEGENKDREALYAKVAELKKIDSSQLEKLQRIFAEKWIDKAKNGWWVQDEEGEWIRKTAGPGKDGGRKDGKKKEKEKEKERKKSGSKDG